MTDIRSWLAAHHLEKYADTFAVQEVGIDQLSELTDADLKELGVAALGDRKRLLKAANVDEEKFPRRRPTAAQDRVRHCPVRLPRHPLRRSQSRPPRPPTASKRASAATPPSCSPISPATRR